MKVTRNNTKGGGVSYASFSAKQYDKETAEDQALPSVVVVAGGAVVVVTLSVVVVVVSSVEVAVLNGGT